MADSGMACTASLAGLFPILRQVRIRAGLTQQQIAQATGAGGRHGQKLIARLEAGKVPNPSARLVLDYLRACKATAADLTGFLDSYLGAHLPVPERHVRARHVPKPKPEDAATLALRKEAAWWNLLSVIEHVLHCELTKIGAPPMSRERKQSADFGRKVFRILYQTRAARPAFRARRLKRCRAWAERKALPPEALDYLHKAVTELFEDMEAKGELDSLPPAEDAKNLMLLSPRNRVETDYDLCRNEQIARMAQEHEARETARKPVIEAALNLLRSEGLNDQQIGSYRAKITAFLNIAESTEPGSPQRARRIEETVTSLPRPYVDQSLLRRLAELVTSLRDQRT